MSHQCSQSRRHREVHSNLNLLVVIPLKQTLVNSVNERQNTSTSWESVESHGYTRILYYLQWWKNIVIFGGKCKNKDITHVSLECLKLLRQLRGKKPEWLPIWEWFFFFHKAFKYLCPVHTEAISVCFGLRQAYSVSYVLYMVLRICMWIHRKDFATSSIQF